MNWGNRLLFVFIVFAGGMAFLVYRCLHTNYELVEPDYYATELKYQQVIEDGNRARELDQPVMLSQEHGDIRLQLPGAMKNRKTEGSIWFYCAYDRNKDRKFVLTVDPDGVQTIPLKNVEPGNYSVKLSWKADDKGFYTEQYFKVL